MGLFNMSKKRIRLYLSKSNKDPSLVVYGEDQHRYTCVFGHWLCYEPLHDYDYDSAFWQEMRKVVICTKQYR